MFHDGRELWFLDERVHEALTGMWHLDVRVVHRGTLAVLRTSTISGRIVRGGEIQPLPHRSPEARAVLQEVAHRVVDYLGSGYSLVVKSKNADVRELVVRKSNGGEKERIALPLVQYERVMDEVVSALAAGHPSRFTILAGITHFGQQWVEVRSGLFGRRVARLGIAPRHIARLNDLISAA